MSWVPGFTAPHPHDMVPMAASLCDGVSMARVHMHTFMHACMNIYIYIYVCIYIYIYIYRHVY